MSKLDDARLKINKIDEEMAKLFEERMKAASEIASYKLECGLPIFDESREKLLIERNSNYINDEVIKQYYINFLKEEMNISKKYQFRLMRGIKVAYSGVPGAFAHIAAKQMFPESELVSYPSFEEAYNACETGDTDICVLPLENSYAGEVGVVMDLIFSKNLYINQVIELPVCHNLLVKKGTKFEDITTVISHTQALSQCREFIKENNLNQLEAFNTAVAAKMVSESNDSTIAAIASNETASLYGLEILKSNINTNNDNTTRFGAFTRSLNINQQNKQTEHFILVFTVKNEAGSLAKTLNIIGSYGFNMRTLRSRLMKNLIWNYYFYVELDGNINSQDAKDMLKALQVFCDKLKVVGTYEIK